MDSRILKGTLEQWNDEKGFGFIRSEGNARDIFIHISAFKRNITRRPENGDIIFHQTHTDSNGKIRAVNAKIEGMAPETAHYRRSKPATRSNSWFFRVIILLLIISSGVFIYNKYAIKSSFSKEASSLPKQTESLKNNYSCQGKVYCSEMTSCEEATFYLHNCPGTEIDGDGDGIPCERQWCSW
jgi:cold shock CspA family protein